MGLVSEDGNDWVSHLAGYLVSIFHISINTTQLQTAGEHIM